MTHPYTKRRSYRGLLPTVLLALALSGCGGGGSDSPSPPPNVPTPPAATLTAAASATQVLAGGGAVQLSATASDASQITWQLAAGSPGSLSATSGAKVNYLPPAGGVSTPTTVTVTATAAAASTTLRLAVYPDPGAPRLELIAGSLGSRGQLDGSGTSARFESIAALAVDAQGNALVADSVTSNTMHSNVRLVTPAGVVTTLSRLPSGHADGDAAHGQMGAVSSIAPAPDGTLYLLDRDDALRVRALRANGSIATVLDSASVDQRATRLLANSNGVLYLLTPTRVLRIANGATTVVAGSDDGAPAVDGSGAAARFAGITDGVISADGVLFVVNDNAVRAVTLATGQVTTIAGVLDDAQAGPRAIVDGSGSAARFSKPDAIALGADGDLLVLDRDYPTPGSTLDTKAVLRNVTRGGAVTTIRPMADPIAAGEASPGSPTMHTLLRAAPNGSVLLASAGAIQRGTVTGNFFPFAGMEGDTVDDADGPFASARLMRPNWIAADGAGTLYVTDTPGSGIAGQPNYLEESGIRIRRIAPDGTVSTILKQDGNRANGIVVAPNGDLYVGVRPVRVIRFPGSGGYVMKVTPAGAATIVAGAIDPTGVTAPQDGTGTDARFGEPFVTGIDADGNVYVRDSNRGTPLLRKVTPAGVVTTIAALPAGLKAAPDGNTYSVDRARHVVLRTTPDGTSTVVAGVPDLPGPRLGALPGLLYQPVDIVPIGPAAFGLVSGGAVIRLVAPH